jgi:hypothetical protein
MIQESASTSDINLLLDWESDFQFRFTDWSSYLTLQVANLD